MNAPKIVLLFLFLCPAFLSFAQPMAGTYTVNSFAITSGTNFNNFNDLADSLSARGVSAAVTINVVVGSGPYYEQVVFNDIAGTSISKTVTINGNGEGLTYAPTVAKRYIMLLNEPDYMIIDSLRIFLDSSGGSDYCYAIQLINDAKFNTIRKCWIAASTGYGATGNYIAIYQYGAGGSNNQFLNNEILNSGYAILITALASGPAYGCLIQGNYIHDCLIGPYVYRYVYDALINNNEIEDCYYGFLAAVNCHRTTISNNSIHRCVLGIYASDTSDDVVITDNFVNGILDSTHVFPGEYAQGIVLSDTMKGAYIARNTVRAQYIGIRVERNSDSIRIENNCVSIKRGTLAYKYRYGMIIRPIKGGNISVVNNTIAVDSGDYDQAYALYYWGDSSVNNEIINNSFTGQHDSYGAGYLGKTASSLSACDHNNWYKTDTGSTLVYFNAAYCKTLADIQAQAGPTGHDLNSMSGNPIFKSIDYLYPRTYVLDAAGTNATGLTEDVLGLPRPAVVGDSADCGCYEFDPSFYFPIRGNVYEDLDTNCILDSLEPGESGITVYFIRSGVIEDSTISNTDGSFEFFPITDGAYRIQVAITDVPYDTCNYSFLDGVLGTFPDSAIGNEFLVWYDTADTTTTNHIRDLSQNFLKAYPNPINDYLLLELNPSSGEKVEILVHSLDGRLVYRQEEPANSNLNLDLSHLEAGWYSVSVKIDNLYYGSRPITKIK